MLNNYGEKLRLYGSKNAYGAISPDVTKKNRITNIATRKGWMIGKK